MTNLSELEKNIDEMCDLVEEFGKYPLSTDTPAFSFQQTMLGICRKFRKEKLKIEPVISHNVECAYDQGYAKGFKDAINEN